LSWFDFAQQNQRPKAKARSRLPLAAHPDPQRQSRWAGWPHATRPRARQKKKTGDPRGWWVGQSTKKDWGLRFIFFDIFLIVFLNSPHRETPKNVLKQK
jgi:hypothetical protein